MNPEIPHRYERAGVVVRVCASGPSQTVDPAATSGWSWHRQLVGEPKNRIWVRTFSYVVVVGPILVLAPSNLDLAHVLELPLCFRMSHTSRKIM